MQMSLEVCSECEYQSLDQALAYAEEDNVVNNSYDIILYDSGTYSISRNYNMIASIYIVGNSDIGNYVFNGNNHTINTMNNFGFDSQYSNLSIKNITFNIQDFHDSWEGEYFLYLFGQQVTIDGLSIVNKDRISYDTSNWLAAAKIESSSLTITNTTISNFMIGFWLEGRAEYINESQRVEDGFYNHSIHSHDDVIQWSGSPSLGKLASAEIDSCDLYDNVLSVYSEYTDLEVSNTRLSSIEAYSSYIVLEDSNDYGDVVIKKVDYDSDDSNFWRNIVRGSLDHQYIYLVDDFIEGESSSNYIVRVKKSESMNISTHKEANLLDYFIHIDRNEMNLYRFSVSDESVAKIENGKVVFLKAGEVDVIATDSSGNVSYTVHFRLDDPNASVKPSVNPKTVNSILFISLILLMLVIPLVVSIKSQKSSS